MYSPSGRTASTASKMQARERQSGGISEAHRQIDQFHPSEFSAIMGAEICCVRALGVLRSLPRLSRPPSSDNRPPLTGVSRPPDIRAPPISAPLGSGSLLYSELDLARRDLRCLYRRATKNMAAP